MTSAESDRSVTSAYDWPSVLGDVPAYCAERFGDRIAFVSAGRETSFSEWAVRTENVAQAVVAAGAVVGGRVGLLAVNDVPFFDGYLGAARAGAVAVPLGTRLSVDEITFVLQHSDSRLLMHDASSRQLAESVQAANHDLILMDLESVAAQPGQPTELPVVEEGHLAAIFYTSGSTASPKGVCLTHRNVLACALACATAFRITHADAALGVLPLYHTATHFVPLPTLLQGGRVVLKEGFKPASAFALLQEHKVTLFPTVTAIAVLMANHPDAASADLGSLRKVMLGGANVPTSTLAAWKEIAPSAAVVNCYGMTEMAPAISVMDPSERPERVGTVGFPYPGNEIRIEKEDGTWGATDEVGEICVRGPSQMAGYWRNQAATEAVLRDGWLATGDLGRVDADGYLTIVGRKKWMLKRGGENVFPDEVETALMRHPGVHEVIVVGVPDDVMGERIAAVVSTHPDAESLAAAELREFALGILAPFKVPELYSIRSAELPKNAVGKVDAARLKSGAADGTIAWTDLRRG
jgi:acyl-CoA synthetase (AMP-forming)/AMP-acid ligase II